MTQELFGEGNVVVVVVSLQGCHGARLCYSSFDVDPLHDVNIGWTGGWDGWFVLPGSLGGAFVYPGSPLKCGLAPFALGWWLRRGSSADFYCVSKEQITIMINDVISPSLRILSPSRLADRGTQGE